LGGCVYYSQNREDLVLLSFFPDKQKGVYVDVGGYDPDIDSVTKLFYLQGWHGVNVEPQVDRFKLFEKHRPRDINVNAGISTKEGTLTLRTYKSQGLSTFSDEVKRDYEKSPGTDTKEFSEAIVPVRPLKDVLAENNITHIDFMKVDVEGLEYEVLASNDWKKFRPEVLCIEANHVKHDWHPMLKELGYELVFDDGLNEYFADSKTDRKQKFNYVEDVITKRGGGLRTEHYEMMLQLYKYAIEKENHVQELSAENERLMGIIKEYEHRLAQYDVAHSSIKSTTGRLVRLTSRKLTRKQ
ncbi:MAG: FkbM family methyltransferase, partial [Candidatus Saccharibacteria bacterium]